jgi:hypothetical protein
MSCEDMTCTASVVFKLFNSSYDSKQSGTIFWKFRYYWHCLQWISSTKSGWIKGKTQTIPITGIVTTSNWRLPCTTQTPTMQCLPSPHTATDHSHEILHCNCESLPIPEVAGSRYAILAARVLTPWPVSCSRHWCLRTVFCWPCESKMKALPWSNKEVIPAVSK